MRSLNKVTNGSELINEQKVDKVISDVELLSQQVSQNTDNINNLQDEVQDIRENPVTSFDNITATRIENSYITSQNVESDSVNTASLEADTGTISNLNSTELVASNITANEITAQKVTAEVINGNVSLENADVDELTADVINNDTLNGDAGTFNTVTSNTVTASSVNGTHVTADDITAVELNASTIENTSFNGSHIVIDDVSLNNVSHDVNTLVTEMSGSTQVIEVSVPQAGSYTVTAFDKSVEYEDLGFLFSFTLYNNYGNIHVDYAHSGNINNFSQIYIKDGKFYVKTNRDVKLTWKNDSRFILDPPKTYADFPFDTSTADYKYEPRRKLASIYFGYAPVNISADSGGEVVPLQEGVLDGVTSSDISEATTEFEFNQNEDTAIIIYKPDQSVNTDDDVQFDSVTADGVTTDELLVTNGLSGQYLRENTSGSALQWETPITKNAIGGLQTTDHNLIEASAVAQWDGSTTDSLGETVNPISKLGEVTEGEWNAGNVTAPDITATNDLTVGGDATVTGDLTVMGKTITVHSEEITTEENTIELRHDAQTGLLSGEVSGILINNYDGNDNDSEIVLDSTGTLRIGDTASLEPVATRDEATNFTDGHLTTWDATNSRLVDAGASVSDILSAGTTTVEGWTSIVSLLGTPTDVADLVSKAQTYMSTNNLSEMRLTAYTTSAQASSYIGLTWTTNVVFDLQVRATSGFKARFFDNTHFAIFNNNNWDVNIINDVIVKDTNGELTVTSNEIQSDSNLTLESAGDITVAPTNAFVIPTTEPTTFTAGAIWIA